MANKKISQLTPKGSALAGTDLLEVSVFNGVTYDTKSLTGANVVSGLQPTLVSGTSIKTINSTTLLGSGDLAVQPTLVSATNIKTINSTSLLGSGDIAISTGLTVGTTAIASGTVGRILFEGTGNVVQQDSTLFWDNTNKRLGVGATPSTSVRLDVRAQGALSTDIAFRVRNSADTANILTVNGDGTQNWFTPGNNALASIKSSTYNVIQYGNDPFFNIAVGYNASNMITPTKLYCTLLGCSTTVLADGGTRVGAYGTVGVGGDYGIAIGYGVNVRGNSTIHIGRRTGASSFSGTNSIHLGKTPSGNDIAPSNVFMTHFDSEYASTLARGNGSFGLLGQGAYILADGSGIYGTDTFMGNGGNTLVVRNHASIPSTNVADSFQQYSADITAGNAAPHFRTENGNVIKIYRETTAVAAAAFVANTSLIANDTATFGGYTMGQVVAALKAQGLLA
jgi:hypothetical protein